VAKRILVGKILIVYASSVCVLPLADDATRRSLVHHPRTQSSPGHSDCTGRRWRDASPPPSSGRKQVRTTLRVAFRAVIGLDVEDLWKVGVLELYVFPICWDMDAI
jgi:hypothetical protein